MPDLDALYNNRAHVPEHPALFAAYERDAAAYRASASHADIGLHYGDGPRMTYDFFPRHHGEAGPVFVFIHGGYWLAHSPAMYSHLARGVNANGFDCVMLGYDLVPQVTLAGLMEEVIAGCIALARRFRRPLVVSGHSAGGHLAAMLACVDWASHGLQHPICAIAPVSGVFDLAPLRHTYLQSMLALSEQDVLTLSPLLKTPPAGLVCEAVVGAAETAGFVAQSRVFADRWRLKGCAVGLTEMAGANHFTVITPLSDPESLLTRLICGLLRP